MLGAFGVIRNYLQHNDDPPPPPPGGVTALPGPAPKAVPPIPDQLPAASMPRFGPNSAPYAGMPKFDDSGERFGASGGGFDPMMRQRLLSQNLRG